MSGYKTITYQTEEKTASICFNRPEVRNGFNEQMIEEVRDALKNAGGTQEVQILVFKGKGKCFSAGADLNWLGGVRDYTFKENYAESINLARCFNDIYSFPKPTLAVVHGASIGGANGFLAACDMAICEHETIFSLSEVKIGVVPSCISPYIFKKIGEFKTKELMLSGKRIKGPEAESCGLVNKSLPAGELAVYEKRLISEILDGMRNKAPIKSGIEKTANKGYIYLLEENQSGLKQIEAT